MKEKLPWPTWSVIEFEDIPYVELSCIYSQPYHAIYSQPYHAIYSQPYHAIYSQTYHAY